VSAVFNYSNPRFIRWGPGSIANLAPELDRMGARRVVMVTTRSLVAEERLIAFVRGSLGDAECPATVVVSQHAPIADVEAAASAASEAEVDGVVSFGGGSAIDTAKMVSVRLADRAGRTDHGLPHIAVPTTLSAAELAGGAGFTDPTGTKAGMRDPRFLPDCVIYDAELTLATPMQLWLSTGIRALDHAVEGFLADGAHPFSDVLALEAVRGLFYSLPRAMAAPDDIGVRTANQLAAWFSFTLPGASAAGLSHVMGKQIGARHGIPHGVTSCLLLPHVMRYLAREMPDRMTLLAQATGVDPADRVDELIASLDLPQHISEYHVGQADLRKAAEELAGRYPASDLLAIYLAAL
jgi:alcohol dehydrogenase class IV